MIAAVTQTLAELLSAGSSSIDPEHIHIGSPRSQSKQNAGLNLYCYDLRARSATLADRATEAVPESFAISFLISAWGFTALGEQQILSDALLLLWKYRVLPDGVLAPTLRGRGQLRLHVATEEQVDLPGLWLALGVPLRPSLSVKVIVPTHRQTAPSLKRSPSAALAPP